MRTLLLPFALAATMTAPALPAAAQPTPARDCFYVSDVTGFRSGGPGVIYMSTAQGRIVRLDTLNACRAAQSSNRLAVSAPGSPRVCRPVAVEVLVTDAVAGRRCPVRALRTLTAAEAARLPRHLRP